MPLYDLRCSRGHLSERMIPLSEFEAPIICACTAPAQRVISAPMFNVENVEYDCPVTGKMITSRRAHEDNLKLQGCRVWESGETRMADEARQAKDRDFDKAIDQTIEKQWDGWDGEKREALAKDLVLGGADLAVERG